MIIIKHYCSDIFSKDDFNEKTCNRPYCYPMKYARNGKHSRKISLAETNFERTARTPNSPRTSTVRTFKDPELSNIWSFKQSFSYKNVVKDNQIDLILYVASAEERPDLKLFKALQKAKLDSKDEKARSKLK